MKFRKKPVVIDAEQYLGPESVGREDVDAGKWPIAPEGLVWHPLDQTFAYYPFIETLEGRMLVRPEDWIITGVKGERYPCKPDIFAATYEPVE